MINIDELIAYARSHNCSDVHLSAQLPPMFRRVGQLEKSDFPLTEQECQTVILSMMNGKQKERFQEGQDVDFSYTTPDGYRQRVNVYRQQGKACAAIRILNDHIPTLEDLLMPPVLKKLAAEPRGLILVTGPTGSGKSTTLAAMIQHINSFRRGHIITIEDPVEYVHHHGKAMIHQREVGQDVDSFASALRSAMREDPDVILVGEMRDYETISAAVTAAETGHLVLSTLHTTGAANTIDRIIDVFPASGQGQIRTQLASVLKGVVTQQLVPLADGSGRIAALEILIGTDAVRNLIRDNKAHQLASSMQTGGKDGMQTLNDHLARLVQQQKISYDIACDQASDLQELNQYLG